MADLKLADLTAPVTAAAPCGPDLDAEDDDAYTNFMSATEMVLPEEYMVFDGSGKRIPFHQYDRFKDLDFGERLGAASVFVGRTHDLRLLTLVAKLNILNKSLDGFQTSVEAIAVLTKTYWPDIHPSDQRRDFEARVRVLERLGETLIVSALNNIPLFRSKHYGPLTGQAYAAARHASDDKGDAGTSGVDKRLADEIKSDPGAAQRASETIEGLRRDLRTIKATIAEHTSTSLSLDGLTAAVDLLSAMFDRILRPSTEVAVRPSLRLPDAVTKMLDKMSGKADRPAVPDLPATTSGAGAIRTSAAAAAALAAATRFVALAEPSSPALFLLRQAQALIGKSFLEALEALAPDKVDRVNLNIDQTFPFDLPLTRLAEKGLPAPAVEPHETAAQAADHFAITSQHDAVELLSRASDYFRAIEPSSPVSLLIDRSLTMMGQDFLTLYRAVLSRDD